MRRPLPTLLKVRRRPSLVTPILAAVLLGIVPSFARADPYVPPGRQIFQGEAGPPVSQYEQAVGKHAAVYQVFSAWGEYLPAIFQDAANAQARLMIHVTTASGPSEVITPAAIADGAGDAWLIALNNAIYASGRITYVRLMAEMDNAANEYSAFNADGTSRGPAHSPAAYKQAWRRITLILRGGPLSVIDAKLRALGMPPLHAAGDLPQPQVAMLWVPMTAGSPDIRGNQPSDYWPGGQWVDWVGTDFYSKFPDFRDLDSFYAAFPGFPFAFGEWAVWGADDPGFVDQFFAWIRSHPRVRLVMYNQGLNPTGPLRLSWYPRAAAELRRILSDPLFAAFTPDWGGQATGTAASAAYPAQPRLADTQQRRVRPLGRERVRTPRHPARRRHPHRGAPPRLTVLRWL